MKKIQRWILVVLLFPSMLAVSGCGPKHAHEDGDGHDHGSKSEEVKRPEKSHEDHDDKSSGATYVEGKGISLSEETRKSLGLEMAGVEEREIAPTLSLTAQIYRAANEAPRLRGGERFGNAYATALIPMAQKEKLTSGISLSFAPKNNNGSPREGILWKLNATQTAPLGKVEALLELPDPEHTLHVGDFIEARISLGEKRKTLAIPRSALLETSTGYYAFVQNGDSLLRTEIKIGLQTDHSVEVTAGLYEGDEIVVKPVEALHLIELRATKGGGHSH